jgi:hypothetical protein
VVPNVGLGNLEIFSENTQDKSFHYGTTVVCLFTLLMCTLRSFSEATWRVGDISTEWMLKQTREFVWGERSLLCFGSNIPLNKTVNFVSH